MNKNRFFRLLGVGVLFLLTACQATGQSSNAAFMKAQSEISGMHLATGAADAPPLWAYCSPSQENAHIRTFYCRASVGQTLAVGHLFLLTDVALLNRTGAEL